MTSLAAPIALAAAVAFGWSTALLRHLIVQWRWLAGMAASLIGLMLHAIALRLGSLTLLQPLVVTGLVFSFVFRDALDRRFPGRRTITWGLLTAAGLALFLAAEGSSSGSQVPDERGTVLLIAAGLAVSGLAYLASVRIPRHVGLLLGASAGIVFGLIAGVLKATTAPGPTDIC